MALEIAEQQKFSVILYVELFSPCADTARGKGGLLMAVHMLGRLNRQWKHDMLRPVYTMRSIQSGSRLLWKRI